MDIGTDKEIKLYEISQFWKHLKLVILYGMVTQLVMYWFWICIPHTLVSIINFILLFSLYLYWWCKTCELVIFASLKISPWGSYLVFQDFSPCLVDRAIPWVSPAFAIVLLD